MRRLAIALGLVGLLTGSILSCGDDDDDQPIVRVDGGTTRDASVGTTIDAGTGTTTDGGTGDGGTRDGGTGGGDGGI